MLSDLTGTKFGRLTVLGPSFRKNNRTYCLCVCECGTQKEIQEFLLKIGNTLSCGCLRREKIAIANNRPKPDRPPIKLIGKKFSRLTLISYFKVGRRYCWLCNCDCGTTITADQSNIVSGNTKSCGCYRIAPRLRDINKAEYSTWKSIRRRCLSPNDPAFHYYGARGIKICQRWRSFRTFLEDMRPRPPGTWIERTDNDGDYDPGNCRWATPAEQSKNKRSNISVSFNGRTMILKDWSAHIGINYVTLYYRIYRSGWPIERALTTPTNINKRRVAKRATTHMDSLGL